MLNVEELIAVIRPVRGVENAGKPLDPLEREF
jgi:hypothetical protein